MVSRPPLTDRGRKRFRYEDARGRPLADEEQLERIRSLVIPPAWEDVWISPNPRARLQATGIDAAGRTTSLAVTGLTPLELAYDGFGRLSEIVQDDGVQLRRTQLFYDDPNDQGLLSRLVDPLGRQVVFAYL